MHISSLPSPYGIGTMGEEAYKFVDFLEKAGQRVWQVLPIGHTSYGDSPYQAYSSYAGNPYFIDLDLLCEKGLLRKEEYSHIPREKGSAGVDYGYLYETRFPILKKAAERLLVSPPEGFYLFLDENRYWIEDYAVFMAKKEKYNGAGRDEWNIEDRSVKDFVQGEEAEIGKLYKAMQFMFYEQWFSLKKYANEKGVDILGDLPIYCASDSSDVWADSDVFLLDKEYRSYLVAGCPPDGFSPLGQRWGNPLYDWEKLEKRGFDWWVERLRHGLKIFDIVRIDHFRGFDSFYAIDAKESTAVNGKWMDGPKMKLFKAFEKSLGSDLPIIAEDLGFLTDSVKELLKNTGYPGMKLLQFAFDPRETGDYLPHNYTENSVCYVGTHDNDTALGWFDTINDETKKNAVDYLNLTEQEGINWGLIRGAMGSVSDLCVITMQDYLSLGSDGRMNTPSTNSGNWQWRMKKGELTDDLANKIKKITRLYGR